MQLELNFRDWLLNEHNRSDHRYQKFRDRVNFGKDIEKKVMEALINMYGWDIDPSTDSQDMHEKVDGWIMHTDDKMGIMSEMTPLQVKYRDTGNDLLMEVIKKWSPDMLDIPCESCCTGRDMKGLATIYAVLNQDGRIIRMRKTHEARTLTMHLLRRLFESHKSNPKKKCITLDGSQIRFTKDPSSHTSKVIAYLNPESFQWKVDYKLDKPIWEMTWDDQEKVAFFSEETGSTSKRLFD
jgi:hypothetical protein